MRKRATHCCSVLWVATCCVASGIIHTQSLFRRHSFWKTAIGQLLSSITTQSDLYEKGSHSKRCRAPYCTTTDFCLSCAKSRFPRAQQFPAVVVANGNAVATWADHVTCTREQVAINWRPANVNAPRHFTPPTPVAVIEAPRGASHSVPTWSSTERWRNDARTTEWVARENRPANHMNSDRNRQRWRRLVDDLCSTRSQQDQSAVVIMCWLY